MGKVKAAAILGLNLALIWMSACGPLSSEETIDTASPQPVSVNVTSETTAIPEFTDTPVPTFTPKATDTPQPADTPVPTATSTPTRTPAATDTPVPPTSTTAPTDSPVPPTNTLAPPTSTQVPPTNSPVPPTSTSMPTQPPPPSTNTPIPTQPPPPPTEPPPAAPGPVIIVGVNKSDEFVDIQNQGTVAVDLGGWTLVSEKGNQACGLGGTIGPGQVLRIWALQADADKDGFNCGNGGPIWNNSESDPAVLYDNTGAEVSRW